MPALQWTMMGAEGAAALSRISRTSSTNSTNSAGSSGVPWSGQLRYCIWLTTRASSATNGTLALFSSKRIKRRLSRDWHNYLERCASGQVQLIHGFQTLNYLFEEEKNLNIMFKSSFVKMKKFYLIDSHLFAAFKMEACNILQSYRAISQ
jgi:hypothetical protein